VHHPEDDAKRWPSSLWGCRTVFGVLGDFNSLQTLVCSPVKWGDADSPKKGPRGLLYTGHWVLPSQHSLNLTH
jgi:hypothetical protein